MINMELSGIESVQSILEEIGGKKSMNLFRNTIRGIAVEIAKEAKKRVPENTGNLKRSIKVKARRAKKDASVFMVYFEAGKDARYQGFHWRFVEHGTTKQRARPFFQPSVQFISNNLDSVVNTVFTKKLESAIKRELKKQAKNK
tara:strand:- start:1207 stop:1638 length:432 start_codon:yes stop_codon:yes gene_type:complete